MYIKSSFPVKATRSLYQASSFIRCLTTHTARVPKKEGDISSVFISLSGASTKKLPERFAAIKRQLVAGNEDAIRSSWRRLLESLAAENKKISQCGHTIVPQIDFADLSRPSDEFLAEVRKRGVAVVRGVVPENEARSYKAEVEEYVRSNPGTKAFPAHDPQVFELYWSPPQIRARAHPNLITTQRFLMNFWHSADFSAEISTSYPLVYADRLRVRRPGDTSFALGPHVDGGSVERWEPDGYGLGGVYDAIWAGEWEQYDPWEASARIPAVSDLYRGAGACSMFRMFQGWLSMSHTGPGEGTLMVNPLLQLATAYFLLRPFFEPVKGRFPLESKSSDGGYGDEYLSADNWRLMVNDRVSSDLHGAYPGHVQELSEALHPHLNLGKSMVHIPQIKPGDYVVWHCDSIHAVDKMHRGSSDSSVLYIPVCPITEANARYLARQREAFLRGYPGPDFPGGKGEAEHIGRWQVEDLEMQVHNEGLQAMGLRKLDTAEETSAAGSVIRKANGVLDFN